jgi:hypothetical protein
VVALAAPGSTRIMEEPTLRFYLPDAVPAQQATPQRRGAGRGRRHGRRVGCRRARCTFAMTTSRRCMARVGSMEHRAVSSARQLNVGASASGNLRIDDAVALA